MTPEDFKALAGKPMTADQLKAMGFVQTGGVQQVWTPDGMQTVDTGPVQWLSPANDAGENGTFGRYAYTATPNADGSLTLSEPTFGQMNRDNGFMTERGAGIVAGGALLAAGAYGAMAGAGGTTAATTAGTAGTAGTTDAALLAAENGIIGSTAGSTAGAAGATGATGGAMTAAGSDAAVLGMSSGGQVAAGVDGAMTAAAPAAVAPAVAPSVAPAGMTSTLADLAGNKGVQALAATGLAAAAADKPSGNTGTLNALSDKQAAISQEALDWGTDYYKDTVAPLQQADIARAGAISSQQQQVAGTAQATGRAASDLMASKVYPLYTKVIDDAAAYNTTDKQNQLSAAAGADAQAAYQQQIEAQRRDMARMGMSPSANMRMAMDQNAALAAAAGVAKSSNDARFKAQDIGYQRTMDAAGLGAKISSDSTAQGQLAVSAGTNAAATSGDALTRVQQTQRAMNDTFGTAITGTSAASKTAADSGNQDIAASGVKNDLIGTIAGTAAGYVLNSKK